MQSSMFVVLLPPLQDMTGGSCTECTCLTLALDMASKQLQEEGVEMPERLSLTYDNTAAQGKSICS